MTAQVHPYRADPPAPAPRQRASWLGRLLCRIGIHAFRYAADVKDEKRSEYTSYAEIYDDGTHPQITSIVTLERCRRCERPTRGRRYERDRPGAKRTPCF